MSEKIDKDNNLEEENQENTNDEVYEKGFLGKMALFFLELIKIAFLAGITIFVIRALIFKPFYVKGQSMEPNFYEKDYLIIDEITYRFREPKRGEVIVLKSPVSTDFYLKRIIGLPSERIKVENGKVIIYSNVNPKGIILDESYLNNVDTSGSVSLTLGSNQYFVLGDNRGASFDSRRFGAISRDAVIGKVWLRGWPFDRISSFDLPQYAIN
ncbi:MAG: signal peptidase I [Candidatus Magasanikbacteria bacterium CG_4_10_14_0_8_um_filter_32_14]|uniref:Signal peptidase I n=2 Tax=Candidatus Magasanikiibacteriota TaxID=1752731 RepID=A0A2M7RBF5_9BACT|nr:MAG: signal peptidase I [Candidatus Magasanikbacteria bacterium CG1_02_32_51]PIY93646.1 MAG: signal peptidase I [Candidatus Magasanikbacteria bacterium CG_4_10_14_0_8_um_filter_32_14]